MKPFQPKLLEELRNPKTPADARLSALQSQRQRHGEETEAFVKHALQKRGFVLVRKVHTPFRLNRATGAMYAVERVPGDFRAVEPMTGRSVLVEAKHYDVALPWSALKHKRGGHQSEELNEHLAANGITEIAWLDRGMLHFMDWGLLVGLGFGSGTSIVWGDVGPEIRGKK